MRAEVYNEDCVTGLQAMEPESVDCCITSIPFGSLFSYSHKTEDIGNNRDGLEMHEGQFGLHMMHFLDGLRRALRPGAVACIHVQQLLCYKVQHGYMGMRDFRGAVITLFRNAGFLPHGEAVICKNPQAVAQRLMLHSLLFVTGRTDSRKLAPAMNDYVLFFRKPKPEGHDGREVRALRDAELNPDGWVTKNEWIAWARGIWSDIRETDVLQGSRGARENEEEKHVCPLQLEVIRRCLLLYTRPGDTVLDPFMGIGSVAAVALLNGRNSVGFELKESYHRMALNNIEAFRAKAEEGRKGLFEAVPAPRRAAGQGGG
jgi:DNA modification methylase